MSVPLVTVITAAYNSQRTLRVALASLRNQTFTDWEAWIVGDACTDDSEGVVRSFADDRLHWVNLQSNHGSQWFPNNEGLRRAQGKYVAFLGHDDIWLPDSFEGFGANRRRIRRRFCPLHLWTFRPPRMARVHRIAHKRRYL